MSEDDKQESTDKGQHDISEERDRENSHQGTQEYRGPPPGWESRIGMGPGGAAPTDFSRVPKSVQNDADYWRGQAMQLEKTVQDYGHLINQNMRDQTFWSQTGEGKEGNTLEDLLKHLWTRGSELIGVFAAVVFLIQLFLFGTDLTPLAQVSGAVALTMIFDRWIRPLLSGQI